MCVFVCDCCFRTTTRRYKWPLISSTGISADAFSARRQELLCACSINSGLQTAALLRGKRKQGLSYSMPLDERVKESMDVLNTTSRKGKLIRNEAAECQKLQPEEEKSQDTISSQHTNYQTVPRSPGARITTKASWDRMIHLGRL